MHRTELYSLLDLDLASAILNYFILLNDDFHEFFPFIFIKI